MAFSFDTFAKDQKQSAIDIVDTITPRQIKQVGAAYKEGLNASPKNVINETLESFTGIDLSQGAGVDGLGAAAKNFIEGQAATLTMQLEQQILGCINTAIRDLMNKVPAVDFILNFEDRINGILGKFRNKLEFKIDAELRKLTYQKLKVQQVALFKQRIAGKIKDICPASTPASVVEVKDFNNKIKTFYNNRVKDNTVTDTAKTLTTDKINEAKVEVKTQVATPDESISNKRKQTFQQDPVETKKIIDEKVAQANTEVKEERKKQLEKKEDDSIEALVETTPTIAADPPEEWRYFKVTAPLNVHLESTHASGSRATYMNTGELPEIRTWLDTAKSQIIDVMQSNQVMKVEEDKSVLLMDQVSVPGYVAEVHFNNWPASTESRNVVTGLWAGRVQGTVKVYKVRDKESLPVIAGIYTDRISCLGPGRNQMYKNGITVLITKAMKEISTEIVQEG
jgi:hypothetical protein